MVHKRNVLHLRMRISLIQSPTRTYKTFGNVTDGGAQGRSQKRCPGPHALQKFFEQRECFLRVLVFPLRCVHAWDEKRAHELRSRVIFHNHRYDRDCNRPFLSRP